MDFEQSNKNFFKACYKKLPLWIREEHRFPLEPYKILKPKSNQELAEYIDHTMLRPEASFSKALKCGQECLSYNMRSACIAPIHVEKLRVALSELRITTVVGFPTGAHTLETKVYEAERAIFHGAHEIDMVLNISALKSKDYDFVFKEMYELRNLTQGRILKVILETCLLEEEDIVIASYLARAAKLDFVKTSTGFSKSGASLKAVNLMRKAVGKTMGVKASGGIKDAETAFKMLEAGANCLGCSSSLSIIGVNPINETGFY